MLLGPHVLIRLLGLLQSEHLLVEDRVDIVGLNGGDHSLQLLSASNVDASECADVAQCVESRRRRLHAAQEADNGNDTLELDSLHTLLERRSTTDLKNVVHAGATSCQLLGGGAPVRVLLVVDDVVGAQLLQGLELVGRGRGGDDLGAGGLGELQGEDADAAGALDEDPLAGEDGLEAVEGVPRREAGACEGRRLEGVQVFGSAGEACLVEDGVLSQRAVHGTAEARHCCGDVHGAELVALVEEGYDLVAGLESADSASNFDNLTGTVRQGCNGGIGREGIQALMTRRQCRCLTCIEITNNGVFGISLP